ncbi:MAG: rod shape-determining protein MreC [Acidobacteriota bacterium]|nr:rod shape-determining protein MreC [Acidobacteriota bacterium]
MHAFITRHAALFVLIIVIAVQLLFLAFQATRKHNVRLIKVWAVESFDPFVRSLRGLTGAAAGAFHTVGDYSKVSEENAELRRELTEARAEARQLAEDGAENSQLRALLDLDRRLPLRTIAAEVIAASPGAGSAFYIDRGAADGVAPDQAVISPDGVVGKTVAVFRHTAQVLLITDPSSGAGAMLEKSRDQGVLKGDGGRQCLLNYIMNGTDVAPGERVVTSGLDQIYPKGLLLGTVSKVAAGSIYEVIIVKPAANLGSLENVLVVLGERPLKTGNRSQNQ